MKLVYTSKNFGQASLAIIAQADRIIREYADQGYDLTLRQLYYQFVSRDIIPNKQSEYKRLGSIINDARLAGMLDWDAIVDRTRNIRALSHWDDEADILDLAARTFKVDLWETQPTRIEVWIEKDALVGVFEPVCQELDVPVFSCRGYVSQSEIWAAAQRLGRYLKAGQDVVILHFGDHDPSGLDMTRDIEDRLKLFLKADWARHILSKVPEEAQRPGVKTLDWLVANTPGGYDSEADFWPHRLEVRRMALTFEQVEQYQPPPNPAKDTDSRFEGYREEHGDESWELDALEPTVLGNLVREGVEEVVDLDLQQEQIDREEDGKRKLRVLSERWEEVEKTLFPTGTDD